MISIKEESCIYISCLASFATGGTEDLHQLGYKLKAMGLPVKMYYYNYILMGMRGDPVADRFKKYDVDYTIKLEDKEGDFIIIPEVALFLVNKFKKAKPIIWWLSVDFYYTSLKYNNNIYYKKQAIKNFLFGHFKTAYTYYTLKPFDPFLSQRIDLSHWVQSAYANDFLIKKGIDNNRITYLSDYLGEDFIKNCSIEYCPKRINRVLYNPAKGIEATKNIMHIGKQIEFIPLQNLMPYEVAKLLLTSKVYMDFGNHPGKDRIPREAAISGTIVITNKKGSAAFDQDVPICSMYKIEEDEGFEIKVINLIESIFLNYEIHFSRFNNYREIIKGEETKFNADLKKIFFINVEK